MLLDEIAGTRMMESFEAGESSLLRPLAVPSVV
jgi:hypothetical protein